MADDIQQSKLDAQAYRDALKEASVIAAESRQTFNDIGAALSNNAKTNKEFAETFKTAQKEAGGLSGVAAKLAQYGKEDLSNSKIRNKLANDLAAVAKKRASTEATLLANKKKLVNAAGDERVALLEANQRLSDSLDTADNLTKAFSNSKEQIQEINNSTGFIDKLAEGLKILPGIGPLLAGPIENLSKGISQFKVGIDKSKTGAEKTAAQLERAKNVTDALGKGALAFVLAGLTKADAVTTEFSKTLGISKSEARDLGQEMNTFAVNSGKAYLTVQKMQEAQMGLADSLGTTTGFTNDQLQDQVMLTKKVGLQGVEAANLLKLSMSQGKSAKVVSEEVLDTVAALEKETGIRLDGRKVLKEVANATGQLGAQYGFNNKALAEAVIISNKLGLSLKETQGIARGLLDFENSIQSELEAELLTGKNINLERARSLALQGKSAEATAEIVKQMGSSAEFARMNVLQQDALAASAGMTADQLAETLRNQETLNALGATSIAQLAEKGQLEKLNSTENGKQLLQNYQNQQVQEKIADLVTKIQSSLANSAEPLLGLVEGFAKLLENAAAVKVIVGVITGALVAQFALTTANKLVQLKLNKRLLKSEIKNTGVQSVGAGAKITAAMASLGPIGAIAGIALGVAAIAGLMSLLSGAKSGNDVMSPGGSGFGSRTLLGPEGAIALNDQDTVIAGTKLFPDQSKNTNNAPSQDFSRMERLLEASLTKSTPTPVIEMNDVKLGTAVDMGAFSIQ